MTQIKERYKLLWLEYQMTQRIDIIMGKNVPKQWRLKHSEVVPVFGRQCMEADRTGNVYEIASQS